MTRWLTIAMMLAVFATVSVADSGRPVTLEAKMILASNDPAPIDPRMERIDFQLRRILRFETFRLLGEGQVMLGLPGSGQIDLGEGNHLEISATGQPGKVRAQVQWVKDGSPVVNTAVSIKGDGFVILGGIPHRSGGKLIVTLNAR